MTDARYPESWLNDRRIVRLSDAAHRLYVTALAWSASNRTDGLIGTEDVALIHGVDAGRATELEAAGLWNRDAGGWHVVDFDRTQTTRAQLEGLDHKRHMDRERKARERARKKDPESADLSRVTSHRDADDDAGPRDEPAVDSRSERGVSRVTSGVTARVTQRQGKARQGQDAPKEEVATDEGEEHKPEPPISPSVGASLKPTPDTAPKHVCLDCNDLVPDGMVRHPDCHSTRLRALGLVKSS